MEMIRPQLWSVIGWKELYSCVCHDLSNVQCESGGNWRKLNFSSKNTSRLNPYSFFGQRIQVSQISPNSHCMLGRSRLTWQCEFGVPITLQDWDLRLWYVVIYSVGFQMLGVRALSSSRTDHISLPGAQHTTAGFILMRRCCFISNVSKNVTWNGVKLWLFCLIKSRICVIFSVPVRWSLGLFYSYGLSFACFPSEQI